MPLGGRIGRAYRVISCVPVTMTRLDLSRFDGR